MTSTLGIVVATDRHFHHLKGLMRAADRRGVAVIVFLTHRGVRLAADPDFVELARTADIGFCRVSLQAQGLEPNLERWLEKSLPHGSDIAVGPGNGFRVRLTTQAGHADLIDRSDRYLVL
jgi:hypothetical protein